MIDELDTNIIKCIIKTGKGMTSTEITKILFSPSDDYELRKLDTKIRYRLEKMISLNLLTKTVVNGKKIYTATKNIIVGKGKLIVKNGNGKTIKMDIPKVIVAKIGEGYVIFSYS